MRQIIFPRHSPATASGLSQISREERLTLLFNNLKRIGVFAAKLLLSSLGTALWMPWILAENPNPYLKQAVRAIPTDLPIRIDGRLDESIWKGPGYSDFTQLDPLEGRAPSEKTTFWVAYDKRALYIAARLEDSNPSLISRRMARRDDAPDSDLFTVALDPYLDRRSGYEFSVNPAGCIIDKVLSEDIQVDAGWDGVWDSAARVDVQGWTVELRIPFHILRFQAKAANLWGIQVSRFIKRKNERDVFIWIRKNENGYVSHFGLLQGLEGIRQEKPLELTPYLSGKAGFSPSQAGNPFQTGRALSAGAGLDIKTNLRSNLVLNATINPDFGQVEVDPAVVNLTAYETYYPEKRSFFVDGGSIFDFGWGGLKDRWAYNWKQPQLFYSRRIGRAPQGSLSTTGYTDYPEVTHILGAAKMTGKLGNGWNVGLLNALTAPEFAQLDEQDSRSERLVEPFADYSVVRMQKEFSQGRHGLGLLSTGVLRHLGTDPINQQWNSSALTLFGEGWGSLDAKGTWVLSTWGGMTRVAGSSADLLRLQQTSQHYFQRPDAGHLHLRKDAASLAGWAGRMILNKQRGAWVFNTSLGALSPGFDVSDAGFQYSSDRICSQVVAGYRWLQPGRVFRSATLVTAGFRGWDFGGNRIINGASSSFNGQFLNYWSMNGGAVYNTPRLSISQTRGGPLLMEPGDWTYNLGSSTDDRRHVVGSLSGTVTRNSEGGRSQSGSLSVAWKPRPSLNLSAGPDFGIYRFSTQWVTKVPDPLMTQTYGMRYIFAILDQRSSGLSFRLNWIFTPRMSLQMYLQTLLSAGHYYQFKEMAQGRSNQFNIYGRKGSTIIREGGYYRVQPAGASPFRFADPDFNIKSLRGTTVFRWEYRPGSLLYFVWTQNRSDNSNPGDFSLGRDLGQLFTRPGTNVFMVKITHYLKY